MSVVYDREGHHDIRPDNAQFDSACSTAPVQQRRSAEAGSGRPVLHEFPYRNKLVSTRADKPDTARSRDANVRRMPPSAYAPH
ncbi:MAG: hypothetical protein ACRYHA_20645, partial [Janthinobacterium lividum]